MIIKLKTSHTIFKIISIILIVNTISPIDLIGKLGEIYLYIDLALLVLWLIYAFIFFKKAMHCILFLQQYWIAFLWPFYLMINFLFKRCTMTFAVFNFKLVLPCLITILLLECKYSKLLNFVKKSIIIYCIVINSYSIYISQSMPGISRILASTTEKLSLLQTAFVGGYNYTYALSLGLPCIMWSGYKKKRGLLLITLIMTSVVYLITAQYTLAVLFCLLFCLIDCVAVSAKKAKILIPVFTLWCVFFKMYFNNILLQLSKILGNFSEQFSMRINAMREYLFFGTTDNAGANERLNQWLLSLDTWSKNKWFGIGYRGYSSGGLVGGHSELMDKLAYFGVIGSGLFLLMLLISYKSVAARLDRVHKVFFTVAILQFIAISFFTPVYGNAQVCVLFVFLPIIGL